MDQFRFINLFISKIFFYFEKKLKFNITINKNNYEKITLRFSIISRYSYF